MAFDYVTDDFIRDLQVTDKIIEGCQLASFSCGLIWIAPIGERLTLCRYNSNNHFHNNQLERVVIRHEFHIHLATERYIRAGLKPEGFAVASEAFDSLDGAVSLLCSDWGIDDRTKITDL